MRRFLPFLLAHATLVAQTPKLRPSASLDLAALTAGEIRVSVEPLVLRRATLGVSLARWWGGQTPYYAVPLSTAVPLSSQFPAASFDLLHPAREYMVDLYARVYPLSFASASPKHRITGYLGGFVGYHRRAYDQTFYPPCVLGADIVCPVVASPSSAPIPCCAPPLPPQTVRWINSGVEPGAEFGVRVIPWGDVFLEVGGRARLITFSDPTGRFEEGQVASRLTLAVGLGW